MCRFYSAGNIFTFPKIRETLGMVYLETQAYGLPVVAFDSRDISEVVQERIAEFLPPFDRRHLRTPSSASWTTRRFEEKWTRRPAGMSEPDMIFTKYYQQIEIVAQHIHIGYK